jgi:hypothetical protein
MPAPADDMVVSGLVTDLQGAPIASIKVGAYRDQALIAKGYTDESDNYVLTLTGTSLPISLLFDVHATLNNATKWHPSVVTVVTPDKSIVIDRSLVEVGQTGGWARDFDALFAYEFAAAVTEALPKYDRDTYASVAAIRIGELKLVGEVFGLVIENLRGFF